MEVILPEEQIRRILAEAEDALSTYITTSGRVEFASSAHIITGTRL